LHEFTVPPEDIGSALRVIARSKISIANLLPARQRQIIERIPGVEAVSPFTWFGGKFKGDKEMMFAQFAMDPKVLPILSPEFHVTRAEYDAWASNRTACIVGRLTAEKRNIKVGDRITLTSIIYPCTLELTVAGIYSGTADDRNMLFHHKYLDEAGGADGQVGTWWIKVRSIEEMQPVTSAINKAFENTSAEVRAETERAFQLSFVSMMGDMTVFIGWICVAVGLALLFVTASTMSMAIRERMRELAILKAIGFQLRDLLGFILAESLGLAAAGGLVGVGGAWLLFTHTKAASYVLGVVAVALVALGIQMAVRRQFIGLIVTLASAAFVGSIASFTHSHDTVFKLTNGFLLTLHVTPKILGIAASVAAALGVVACLAPGWAVARLSVVQGLKTLD
ncbi:MAG: putative transport system permease protein, partial [Verrucomicrobiota bacterium]